MTAEQLIKVCLDLDQQMVCPRPSYWGKAAELVKTLCEHAEGSMRKTKCLGDWESVDISGIYKPVRPELEQPTLDELTKADEIAGIAPSFGVAT